MSKKDENIDFLPKDYTAPSGDFMKFVNGENTFRVMSSAVVGFEYWTKEDKPVRSKIKWTSTPDDIKLDKNGKPTGIKHFWSFVVWNYNDKAIQSLEITQKGVMQGIQALVQNPKWGDPKKYDITVTRSGEGLKTDYSVMPNPHAEISPEIIDEFMSKNIDLEAIFDNKSE